MKENRKSPSDILKDGDLTRTLPALEGVDMDEFSSFMDRLLDGYRPSDEEMKRLEEIPELALQAKAVIMTRLRDIWDEDPENPEYTKAYTDSLHEVGDLLLGFSYYEEALHLFDEAIEICRKATEKTPDAHLSTTLYISHDRMGDVAVTAGDWNEASRQYEIVRKEILKVCALLGEDKENYGDYAVIVDKLGYAAEMNGRFSQAEIWYQESLDVRTKAAAEGDTDSKRGLIESHKNYGEFLIRNQESRKAKGHLTKALEGARALFRETGEPGDLEIVISALDKLGIVAKDEERYRDAEKLYLECITDIEMLTGKFGEDAPEWRRSLSRAEEKLSDSYMLLGENDKAEPILKKSIAKSEALWKELKAEEELKDLTASNDKLADIMGMTGRAEDAVKLYHKSLFWRAKVKSMKGDLEWMVGHFFTLKKISIIARNGNRYSEAAEYAEKALKIMKSIARKEPTDENTRFLADSWNDLGEINEDAEKWSAAKECYTRALTINRKLYKKDPSTENKSEYADTHDGLGFVAIAMNDQDEAEKHFRECLTLNEELLHETGATDEKRALAITCRQLGLIAALRKDSAEAKRMLSRALILQKDVMHESDDEEDRLTYGDIYQDLQGIPCDRIVLPAKPSK